MSEGGGVPTEAPNFGRSRFAPEPGGKKPKKQEVIDAVARDAGGPVGKSEGGPAGPPPAGGETPPVGRGSEVGDQGGAIEPAGEKIDHTLPHEKIDRTREDLSLRERLWKEAGSNPDSETVRVMREVEETSKLNKLLDEFMAENPGIPDRDLARAAMEQMEEQRKKRGQFERAKPAEPPVEENREEKVDTEVGKATVAELEKARIEKRDLDWKNLAEKMADGVKVLGVAVVVDEVLEYLQEQVPEGRLPTIKGFREWKDGGKADPTTWKGAEKIIRDYGGLVTKPTPTEATIAGKYAMAEATRTKMVKEAKEAGVFTKQMAEKKEVTDMMQRVVEKYADLQQSGYVAGGGSSRDPELVWNEELERIIAAHINDVDLKYRGAMESWYGGMLRNWEYQRATIKRDRGHGDISDETYADLKRQVELLNWGGVENPRTVLLMRKMAEAAATWDEKEGPRRVDIQKAMAEKKPVGVQPVVQPVTTEGESLTDPKTLARKSLEALAGAAANGCYVNEPQMTAVETGMEYISPELKTLAVVTRRLLRGIVEPEGTKNSDKIDATLSIVELREPLIDANSRRTMRTLLKGMGFAVDGSVRGVEYMDGTKALEKGITRAGVEVEGVTVGQMMEVAGVDKSDLRLTANYIDPITKTQVSLGAGWLDKEFSKVQKGEWGMYMRMMARAAILKDNPNLEQNELEGKVDGDMDYKMLLGQTRVYLMDLHVGDKYILDSNHPLCTPAYWKFHPFGAGVDRLVKPALPSRHRLYHNNNRDEFFDQGGKPDPKAEMSRRLYPPDILKSALFDKGIIGNPRPGHEDWTLFDFIVNDQAPETGEFLTQKDTPMKYYGYSVTGAETVYGWLFEKEAPKSPDLTFKTPWADRLSDEIKEVAVNMGWMTEYPKATPERQAEIRELISRLGMVRLVAGIGMGMDRDKVSLKDVQAWAVGVAVTGFKDKGGKPIIKLDKNYRPILDDDGQEHVQLTPLVFRQPIKDVVTPSIKDVMTPFEVISEADGKWLMGSGLWGGDENWREMVRKAFTSKDLLLMEVIQILSRGIKTSLASATKAEFNRRWVIRRPGSPVKEWAGGAGALGIEDANNREKFLGRNASLGQILRPIFNNLDLTKYS